MGDASLEIGDHAAEMMRDDLQVGIFVHDAGEDEARQRCAGLERPAKHAVDLVFRVLLRRIVRHVARARGMQRDRAARFRNDFVDRPELRRVDRHALGIGRHLDGIGAIGKDARGFLRRRLRRIQRQQRRIADEAIGIFRDDLGQPVIAYLCHFRRVVRTPDALDGGQAKGQNLRIIIEHVDDAQPLLDVRQSRIPAHALAELLAGRRLQQSVIVTFREKMIEGIDHAHAEKSSLMILPLELAYEARPTWLR